MKMKMKPRKICALMMLTAFFIVLAVSASAIKIEPSQTSFYYMEGEEYSGSFSVIPSTNSPIEVILGVEGELMDNVELDSTRMVIEGSEDVDFRLTGLEGLEEPGNHKIKINAKEQAIGAGQMSMMPEVHHTINLFVPYPGRYLDTSLLIYDDDRYLMQFTTVMESKGDDAVTDVKNHVDIYSNNEKIAELYKAEVSPGGYDVVIGYGIPGHTEPKILTLPRKRFAIAPGESLENQVTVKKGYIPPGEYNVQSVVEYDNEKAVAEGSFRIGKEEIMLSQETKTAAAGETNRIMLLLSTNWNKELENVYVTADIFRGNNKITSLKSADADIKPEEQTPVDIYWDTEGLETGSYRIFATAHFEDEIFVREFSIALMSQEEYVPESYNISPYLLSTFSLVILLIVFSLLMRRIYRSEKKE